MGRDALGAWLTIAVFVLVLVMVAWWDNNSCDDGWYWDNSSESCEVILDP